MGGRPDRACVTLVMNQRLTEPRQRVRVAQSQLVVLLSSSFSVIGLSAVDDTALKVGRCMQMFVCLQP